jgi:hypothetical protein
MHIFVALLASSCEIPETQTEVSKPIASTVWLQPVSFNDLGIHTDLEIVTSASKVVTNVLDREHIFLYAAQITTEPWMTARPAECNLPHE